MRRSPSNSVRNVAFAAAFCVLGIGAGCGKETFNLLPDDVLVVAGRAPSAGASNGAGALGIAGGSGAAGLAGAGGKADSGGFGGRTPFPSGGSAGDPPCQGVAGCPGEVLPCTDKSPFCTKCSDKSDCMFLDAKTCDPDLKRCVQCRNSSQCGPGERCNTRTWRCDEACIPGKDNCNADGQHQFCSSELGLCVWCTRNEDCDGYGQFDGLCYLNVCLQCFENSQCSSQECSFGRCVPH